MDNTKKEAEPEKSRPLASLMKFSKGYQRNGLKQFVCWNPAASCPNDIFAYCREATFCFTDKRYLATIAMATALVELILNKDSRMRCQKAIGTPLA